MTTALHYVIMGRAESRGHWRQWFQLLIPTVDPASDRLVRQAAASSGTATPVSHEVAGVTYRTAHNKSLAAAGN